MTIHYKNNYLTTTLQGLTELCLSLLDKYHPDIAILAAVVEQRPINFRYIRGLRTRVMREFQCDPIEASKITAELLQIIIKDIAEKFTYWPKNPMTVLGQQKMKWVTDEAIEAYAAIGQKQQGMEQNTDEKR